MLVLNLTGKSTEFGDINKPEGAIMTAPPRRVRRALEAFYTLLDQDDQSVRAAMEIKKAMRSLLNELAYGLSISSRRVTTRRLLMRAGIPVEWRLALLHEARNVFVLYSEDAQINAIAA